MSDYSIASTDLNGRVSVPAIFRSFEIAELTVAGVKIGTTAVKDQVGLLLVTTNKEFLEPSELVSPYQGVIEINHDDKVTEVADNTYTDSEPAELQKPTGRQVNNHYIEEPKRTLKDLEDLYPNESPLLAPN